MDYKLGYNKSLVRSAYIIGYMPYLESHMHRQIKRWINVPIAQGSYDSPDS